MTDRSIYGAVLSQSESVRAERDDFAKAPSGIPYEFENLYNVVDRNRDLVTELITRLQPILQYGSAEVFDSNPTAEKAASSSMIAHNVNSQAEVIAAQNHRMMDLLAALDL